MKKKFIWLASLLLVFTFALFGCSGISLGDGPNLNDDVYGNGGSAVIKGNYLYFANAFVDYNEIGRNDNNYKEGSEQKIYGIYRTKLDSNGDVTVDDKGVPTQTEILSYCVGGFANAGLYIFGDYLYYATPFSLDDDKGQEAHGLMRFERVSLDGSKHEELVKEEKYSQDCSFDMVCIDNVVYIVYTTSNKELKVVKCDGGNKSFYTISGGITSYAVVNQKNVSVNDSFNDVDKSIYYTVVEDYQGSKMHYLYRTTLNKNGEKKVVIGPSAEEILVEAVANDKVYYRQNNYLYSTVNGEFVTKYANVPLKAKVAKQEDSSQQTQQPSTPSNGNEIIDYEILDNKGGVDKGILGVYSDGTNYSFAIYSGNASTIFDPIIISSLAKTSDKKLTLLGYQNDEFFYQVADDEALYARRFGLTYVGNGFKLDEIANENITIATKFNPMVNSKEMFDFDNERIFIYEKLADNSLSYLKMYNINTPKFDKENKIYGQFIGVLSPNDKFIEL